jgi:enoyl-CoA hydratase
MTHQTIIVKAQGAVGVITLNRPQALNALNAQLLDELAGALETFDADASVRAMIVTGSEKAFAAGADIKEMANQSYLQMAATNVFGRAQMRIGAIRKPIIAAVSGYALGGGCELAMLCDFIIASDTAKFGQPEVTLGIMPGMGGTQRLIRAIGKAKAMDMILTGRMMDAAEAERSGLVARVVPTADLMTEALKSAGKIAEQSLPIIAMAKETVNRAFESSLADGLIFERNLFHAMFATEDQKEGMAAFAEKRKPAFKDR